MNGKKARAQRRAITNLIDEGIIQGSRTARLIYKQAKRNHVRSQMRNPWDAVLYAIRDVERRAGKGVIA